MRVFHPGRISASAIRPFFPVGVPMVTKCLEQAKIVRCRQVRTGKAHVPGLETSVSLEVMNSSSTGMPSLVFSMPRLIAGMMSSGLVTRSP